MKPAAAFALALIVAAAGCESDNKSNKAKKSDKPLTKPVEKVPDKTKTPPKNPEKVGFRMPTKVPNQVKTGEWVKEAAKDTLGKKKYAKLDPTSITGESKMAAPGATPAFLVHYNRSRVPAHETIRTTFQKQKVWERSAETLNKLIKLPKSVGIVMLDCRQPNAFYDPTRGRIIVCYELVVYFAKLFRPVSKTLDETAVKTVLATMFLFFHEVGHALRHVLKLPVTGPEEDAVDELATLLLLEFPQGQYVAALGAEALQLIQKDKKKRGRTLPFWDEHSFGSQRYYNVICLIYGSNPKSHHKLVDLGYLPKARAGRCHGDYLTKSKAWQTLLKPHFTPAVLKAIGNQNKIGAPTPGLGCSKAVTRMVKLLRKLVVQKQPGRVAEFDRKLPSEMPKMIKICNQKWTPLQRDCVFKSNDATQANRCFAQ